MKNHSILAVLCVAFLAAPMFLFVSNAQTSISVVIQADGSVSGTDLIQRSGDLYTFTADVSGSIVIERDNIVIEGAGFGVVTAGDGLNFDDRINVTARNLTVTSSSGSGVIARQASGCTLSNVNVTAERAGIRFRNVDHTTIVDCSVKARVEYGIALSFSSNNVVANNSVITCMVDAINCAYSSGNVISGNNLAFQLDQFPLGFGVEFDGSTNCTITQNTISGFEMAGINLQGDSNNNTLQANQVVNGADGISVYSSSGNVLASNYVANNEGIGLSIGSSSNNVLRGNQLVNNSQNFGVSAYLDGDWQNDIDESNLVEGAALIYWVNQADRQVPADVGYVALVNCERITIAGLTFVNSNECVLLANTENSVITGNSLSSHSTIRLYSSSFNNITQNMMVDNDNGLVLDSASNNNTIYANTFTGNNHAISLSGSSSNLLTYNNFTSNQNALSISSASDNDIYLNSFVDNQQDVYDAGMSDPYGYAASAGNQSAAAVQMLSLVVEPVNFVPPTPLSVNRWDNGSQGNYWSNYTGADGNGDGIGDTAYYLYGNNQDNYPLMQTTEAPDIPEFSLAAIVALAAIAAVIVVALVARKGKHKPFTPKN